MRNNPEIFVQQLQVTHQCGTETNWLACNGVPAEVFYFKPVLTNYINISGVDCALNNGYNGFREVEIFRP